MIARLIRGAAAAGIVALAVVGCSRGDASESNDRAEEIATVERGDLDIRVEASGTVEPILVVEVKSKASGEITAMHVETGDRVDRGELLAEVDPRDVRTIYEQAQADLEVAEAQLQISESQAARSRELFAANVVTQQETEQAQLSAANARAQVIRARTNLQLAQEKMGDVTIRAPITGTVIQKDVETGQIIASASGNVSGGTTLLLMADLAEMQVRTLVDETDIGKIQPGQAARVQVEAFPNRTFMGTVHKIEPQALVDQNVTMFPVLVRLDNREGLLRPNMNAEVQVEVAQRQDVVLVPNAAVVSMQDAMAAGEVLGLDADRVREGMQAARGPAPETQLASAEEGGVTAEPAGTNGEPAANTDCQTLMAKARTDRASLTDEERTRVRECFQQLSGRAGLGGPGGQRAGSGDSGDSRAAVVFVRTPRGPEARMVTLGLNDWDRSEVVSGIDAGEEVILISVARLRQQQEDMMNRIRERSSPIPGGGRR